MGRSRSRRRALASHRADTFEDPEVALRERRGKASSTAETDLPPEVEQEVIGQFLREHYTKWIDEPVPALGGKTPREASRTAAGRKRVAALVDDAERTARAMPGGAAADFGDLLRRELGLPLREVRGDGLAYDADQAPHPAAWLAADESLREKAIRTHHAGLTAHPPIPTPGLHASLHQIVENQIAAGEPPETAASVARLVAAGATRHEAIHAVASVVATEMQAVVREERRYDRERIARELARLRAADWRAQAR